MASNAPGKSIAQQKAIDKETQVMMFEGVSLSQLTQIFSQDVRKVKAKLHGLEPTKMRAGHPIYNLAEAARYLVEPIWPIDEYIKRMNHADLPMMLRKEYWAGMRSRQLYQTAAQDLWPTERVVDHISELLKSFALPLRLAADTVDREAGLTATQRQIIIRIMDETLANVHDSAVRMCENKKEVNDGGDAVSKTDDLDEL